MHRDEPKSARSPLAGEAGEKRATAGGSPVPGAHA